MKAYYQTRFGGPEVMRYGDLPDPTPGKGELLIDVKASSVNPLDWKLRGGILRLLTGRGLPKPLGSDFAGVVRELGPGAAGFAVGDRVYGTAAIFLGRPGAHAERLVVATKSARKLPDGWSYQQGAALPVAGLTAVSGLRQCGDLAGKTVLVNGATGGVGHLAVQIAKAAGARVVAVCSPRNAELARTLGADQVLDYSREDVTSEGRGWDVFYDAFGQVGFAKAAPSLAAKGAYASTLPAPGLFLRVALSRLFGGKRAINSSLRGTPADYAELERLVSGGVRALVEHEFPLARAAEAFAACEAGKVRGKVVITVP